MMSRHKNAFGDHYFRAGNSFLSMIMFSLDLEKTITAIKGSHAGGFHSEKYSQFATLKNQIFTLKNVNFPF